MRYIIAITVAGALIGALSLCANRLANSLKKSLHQRLVDAQAAGNIPADVDLDRAEFNDFGTEVTQSELFQVQLLDLWFTFRMLLIPIAIAGSLLVAHLWPRSSNQEAAPASARAEN